MLPVGLCIKDGMIWFVQGCGNQMIGMDALSFQIKKRLRIPCTPWGKDFFHRGLNDKIVDIGNRLLILLNGSDVIYAYDFSFGEIDKVTSLPDGRTFLNNAVLFQDGILFLLPYEGSCLLKYDVYNDCWEEIQVANRNIYMEQPFEIENDVIVAVDGHSNVVCRYHLWENRMEEISIGDRDNHY
ncbi:MAG: hypothetical protein K2O03_02185, partial [Lachnospiraceae bacterium]|nr:hypothetical protein [Lachnospiraceae bacterium]